MNKLKIYLSLICCFVVFGAQAQEDFRKNAPKPGPAPKIEMGKAYQTTLTNGLKVIAVENHKLPRVSFQIFIDNPPMAEGNKAGVASLMGQMLTRGTNTRTKTEIDESIDFIGASLFASPSGMRGSSLTKHKDELLKIMSEILTAPSFPEEEFDKVKKSYLSGLASEKDDPNAIAGKVSRVLRYGLEHPYGEVETKASIENVTLDDIRKWYVDTFQPDNAYLIVVGDITPAEVDKIANQYFLKWAKSDVPSSDFSEVMIPKKTDVNFVDKTGAVQSVINITYPVNLKPGSADAIKASVMNTYFGGFFGSRLNQNIREDKGYSYGVRSTLSNDPYVGYFTAGGSVRNEVTDSAIVEFVNEMEIIRKEPISQSDLDRVKSVMSGNFARRLETPETVARYALNIARYNLPADYYANYLKNLDAVTAEDIMAMAKKYIRPDAAHIVVVGNKDEVADKLKRFAIDEKINYFDADGNAISATGKSIPDGVTAESIIEDYVQAIGGKDAVKGLNTIKTTATATMQGMTIESKVTQKAPNSMLTILNMNGSPMQKIAYNGKSGYMEAMGNKQEMPEGMLAGYEVGYLIPEAMYEEVGATLELKGLETVNGEDAYKVITTFKNGQKSTDFYSQKTGLKIRTIKTEMGQTQTVDHSNYKAVNGISFPHKMSISGGSMPMTLDMQVTEIKVNEEVDEGIFKVE